jgi:amino acid permease
MLGLPLGFVLNLVVDYISYESGMMYMALRSLMPGQPNSLYEIGFVLLGRGSIFANALTALTMSFCLMLIYLIVLSTTLAEFIGDFFDKKLGEVWYSSKAFYVLIVGVSLLFIVLKKDLAELKWISALLFFSIGIFILMSLTLFFDPRFVVDPSASNDIWIPKNSAATFGAFCTVMVAYGYQINIFPIYDSLKEKTTGNFKKAQTIGLLLTTGIYLSFSLIAILLFRGSISPSVLDNFGAITTPKGNPFFESRVIQVSFIVVLFCHIPFLFFAGKEGLCIVVDEL